MTVPTFSPVVFSHQKDDWEAPADLFAALVDGAGRRDGDALNSRRSLNARSCPRCSSSFFASSNRSCGVSPRIPRLARRPERVEL